MCSPQFVGAIVIVSHDRYFLDRICTGNDGNLAPSLAMCRAYTNPILILDIIEFFPGGNVQMHEGIVDQTID